MIDRYTRPEMGQIWSAETKFDTMKDVEVAVAQVQAELGIIPKKAAQTIKDSAMFSIERILELEKTTKHDVIAFISNLAENCGDAGRFIHYGMTSSDILDTALSLQVRRAYKVLQSSLDRMEKALGDLINKHKEALCAGRTHGIHAEPTTFGLKMSGFMAEFQRNRNRLEGAVSEFMVGKLSGAVGAYSSQPMEVEEKVCRKLDLNPETVATQVIPRDRHAMVLFALSMVGCGLERLSVELRHLQRTEVAETVEEFTPGQKGSSAMPHKKNPISAENLTGVARLLRSYQAASLENIALWHERDISHSSVERVIFPDAFILCDYAVDRMAQVLERLDIQNERMLKNMDLSQGHLFSSQILLALVDAGLSREEAYNHVQRVAHNLKPNEHMKEALLRDKEIGSLLNEKDLKKIFSGESIKKNAAKIIGRLKGRS